MGFNSGFKGLRAKTRLTKGVKQRGKCWMSSSYAVYVLTIGPVMYATYTVLRDLHSAPQDSGHGHLSLFLRSTPSARRLIVSFTHWIGSSVCGLHGKGIESHYGSCVWTVKYHCKSLCDIFLSCGVVAQFWPSPLHLQMNSCCRLRLKCDVTRAETRFRFSAKRTESI